MDEDGFFRQPHLRDAHIAVVGMGLMGGSLALALRGRCARLYGIDPDPAVRALASAQGVVDRVSASPADLLPLANLVILAAPVNAILQLLPGLDAWHPGRCFVLDIGSTKTSICAAMQALPERFIPLGGHPMCGKEQVGLAHASPNLFQEAAFVFCALPRTPAPARALAQELAGVLSVHPLWLEPTTHDRWVASTSHLPYLLACALALSAPPEAAPLVGSGFRSTSRVAGTGPGVMQPVLEDNRQHILSALESFRSHLDALETALRQDDHPALQVQLALAAERQRSFSTPRTE
jgi:prephenate dehydrogenase